MNQKSIIAVLIIVVVILAGTTVYFATIKNASQPIVPTPKVSQQPTINQPQTTQSSADQPVSPTTSTTPSDWQTYRGKKFGFSLQHPRTMAFISEKEERFGENTRVSLMVDGGKEWQNRPFPLLAVTIWTKDEYSKLLKNPDSYSSTQLKAGMSKAIEKDGKVYELTFGFQDGPTQLTNFVQTEDYKKLLSTFKFTD